MDIVILLQFYDNLVFLCFILTGKKMLFNTKTSQDLCKSEVTRDSWPAQGPIGQIEVHCVFMGARINAHRTTGFYDVILGPAQSELTGEWSGGFYLEKEISMFIAQRRKTASPCDDWEISRRGRTS